MEKKIYYIHVIENMYGEDMINTLYEEEEFHKIKREHNYWCKRNQYKDKIYKCKIIEEIEMMDEQAICRIKNYKNRALYRNKLCKNGINKLLRRREKII